MIYPEYKRDVDCIQMLLPDRHPTENDYQYEMLIHNQIQGMIGVKKQFSNGLSSYCYDISNKQSLAKGYEGLEMDYSKIRGLLIAIRIMLGQMREYLMDENGLLLYPEYIYTDMNRQQIQFVFYPETEDIGGYMLGMRELSEFLISHTDHSDDAAVALAYALFKEVRNENFTMQGIMELVDKLDMPTVESELPDEVCPNSVAADVSSAADGAPEPVDSNTVDQRKEKRKMILISVIGLICMGVLVGSIYARKAGNAEVTDYMLGMCFLLVPMLGWLRYRERFH